MKAQPEKTKKRKNPNPAKTDETGRPIASTSRWRRTEKGRRSDRARRAVVRALRTGDLTRPDECECCADGAPEAHHWSYDPAHALEVQWLCRRCHYWADDDRADRERRGDPPRPVSMLRLHWLRVCGQRVRKLAAEFGSLGPLVRKTA